MEEIEKNIPAEKGSKSSDDGGGFDEQDDLIMDAIECVVEAGQASTSMIQRRLKVGYARAGPRWWTRWSRWGSSAPSRAPSPARCSSPRSAGTR